MEATSRSRVAPAAFQWLVFPVVLGGAVAGAMRAMSTGTEAGAAILLPQLVAFAAVAALERVYPLHRSWNRPRRDIRVDATHSITIWLLVGVVTPLVLAGRRRYSRSSSSAASCAASSASSGAAAPPARLVCSCGSAWRSNSSGGRRS
jgi:hypothetical protein